ncbi:hypothetical protein EB74_30085 [Mycobacterium sp. SWH-M5]|uniref:hypothetical protein n=1 Tax=Mycolicibacterium goodii TaxID=134601 RepID=UPI00093B5412|nr:hypothetical protein [Mycolicibacterium goodii]MBU8817529.1 hypothetical protein [Mycolicibacterium goodii]OKH69416.1 hypothetical protein EB74_30085 [Mycobacterium sp. SWH-M5]
MRPQGAWRYRLAYWLFALSLIVLTGKTIAGVGHWVWTSIVPSNESITVDYGVPQSTYYEWPH